MTLNWPLIIVCAVGIAILLMIVVTPQIINVSIKKRLFDRPNHRKVHNGTVPRLGGFAFLPVIVMTLGITLVMPAAYTDNTSIYFTGEFLKSLPDILVLLGTMTIMFLTGLFDDLMGLKYGMKFLTQILCAVILVEAGVCILDFNDLFGISHLSLVMGKILTGLIIIYVINGLNLIDGIDGLASGICVIALGFYGTVLYIETSYILSLLAWTGAAIMAVFWVFNVFGSRRRHTKIFMGDIGSLSMGLLLAFMVAEVGNSSTTVAAWGLRPMILALSPLVLPLFDVIRVFCLRIYRGKSPFLPDKCHVHHMMLSIGLSMRSAMLLLLIIQSGYLALNMWISEYMGINVVMIIDAAIYIFIISALHWIETSKNIEIKTKK